MELEREKETYWNQQPRVAAITIHNEIWMAIKR